MSDDRRNIPIMATEYSCHAFLNSTNSTTLASEMTMWCLVKNTMFIADYFSFGVGCYIFKQRIIVSITMNLSGFRYEFFNKPSSHFVSTFLTSMIAAMILWNLFKNAMAWTNDFPFGSTINIFKPRIIIFVTMNLSGFRYEIINVKFF